MEGKAERAESGEAHEAYTMLLESDAIVRGHRTLQRALCVNRAVMFILLITCAAFCVMLYLQRAPGGQNNKMEEGEQAKEMLERLQAGEHNMTDNDAAATPLPAFLKLAARPGPAGAFLTWERYPRDLCGFSLSDSGRFLVIPRKGWYRLGLQITYLGRKDNSKAEAVVLAHNITKYTTMYVWKPMTVLSVYETVSGRSDFYKSVFSEVVHFFGKDDKVAVECSDPPLIDYARNHWTKTFLTAQFLSSPGAKKA